MKRFLWFHRLCLVITGLTFLLVLAGGVVTSTGSGLAVPDWPLTYGQLFPTMTGGVLYEHGHRLIAGAVGILMIILATWMWVQERRRWIRRLTVGALALIVMQALLGGVTVLFLLPPAVSMLHACVGPTFFCWTVCLALVTSPNWHRGFTAGIVFQNVQDRSPQGVSLDLWQGAKRLRRLVTLTAALLYVQLILGVLFRHTQSGLIPHLLVAAVVAIHIAYVVARTLRVPHPERPLLRSAWWLGGWLLVQLILGTGTLVTTLGKQTTTQPMSAYALWSIAHLGVGTLMVATALVLVFRAFQLSSRIGMIRKEG